MNYTEAFEQTIQKTGPSVLEKPFLFRSAMLDCLGFDLEGRTLLEAFFLLNQPTSLLVETRSKNFAQMQALVKKRMDASRQRAVWVNAANPFFLVIYGKEFEEKPAKAPQKAVLIEKQPKNKKKKEEKNRVEKPLLKKGFRTIKVVATCKKLNIFTHYEDNFQLIDEYGRNCLSSFPISKSNGEWRLSFKGRGNTYTLFVPNKKYELLSVIHNGSSCLIGGGPDAFRAKEISLSRNHNYSTLYVDCEKLSFFQTKGWVHMEGTVNDLSVCGQTLTVSGKFQGDDMKQCRVSLLKGDIFIDLPDMAFRPKIKNPFRKAQTVNQCIQTNGKTFSMKLITQKGYIRIS